MIYFIQEPINNYVKIGFTTNIDQRFPALQTSFPYDLKIIRVIDPGDRSLEHGLHNLFKDNKIKGEWFKFDSKMLTILPEEVEKPINKLNTEKGIYKLRLSYLTEKLKEYVNIYNPNIRSFITIKLLASDLHIKQYTLNKYISSGMIERINNYNKIIYGTDDIKMFKKCFVISKKFKEGIRAPEACENTGVSTSEFTKIKAILNEKIGAYSKINQEKLDMAL